MVDRCHECGSTLFETKKVRMIFDQGDHIKIVDQVPADVCVQCGEKYFSPHTTRALATSQEAPPDEFVLVPVRHLA
jgi:YgiT-type zinc finger domain-containing protein